MIGWAQTCKARLADDAQRETQEFARKVQDVVARVYRDWETDRKSVV